MGQLSTWDKESLTLILIRTQLAPRGSGGGDPEAGNRRRRQRGQGFQADGALGDERKSRAQGAEGGGAGTRMLSQEAGSTQQDSEPNLEDCVCRSEEPSTK